MSTLVASEYNQFTQAISKLLPIQLGDYKQQQMERRIRDMARKHQAPSLLEFATMLYRDARLLREFERHITINVSEFYRNPEAYAYLTEKVLPHLLAAQHGLRIWSAGCSNGAEPYTLAMILHQLRPALRHTIHATDIDRDMLAKARSGKGYADDDVRALPPSLRAAFLISDGATFAVSEQITRAVRFERHDLLRDPMTQTFDLVVCRNVVIYFTDEAKDRLYRTFVQALRPGGYLFIGGTETISKAASLGLTYVAPCFYRKAGPAAGMTPGRA